MDSRSSRSRNGKITVRQFAPDTGWQVEDARALIEQGYSVAHVERLTGWPRQMLLARTK